MNAGTQYFDHYLSMNLPKYAIKVISPSAALIDISTMPVIACHSNCAIATIINDAVASRHDNIMFTLKMQ